MIHRLILAICLASLLPTGAFAQAPVVDDSENFALLEEQQQVATESPLAHDQNDTTDSSMQPALAKDSVGMNEHTNAGLLDKLQGLQQDIQELRGQLEVQAHDLKLLQEQQLSFYNDLDARVRNVPPTPSAQNEPTTDLTIGTKTAKATTGSPSSQPIQPVVNIARANPADEQISYLAAYELVKNKRFDEALTAMQAFVTKYPQGGYTANAEYWLGELNLVKKNYPASMAHFNVVLQRFPTSSKCSASMLKIGYAMAASGKTQEAKERLKDVVKKYPDTTIAQLATAKLESLGG